MFPVEIVNARRMSQDRYTCEAVFSLTTFHKLLKGILKYEHIRYKSSRGQRVCILHDILPQSEIGIRSGIHEGTYTNVSRGDCQCEEDVSRQVQL